MKGLRNVITAYCVPIIVAMCMCGCADKKQTAQETAEAAEPTYAEDGAAAVAEDETGSRDVLSDDGEPSVGVEYETATDGIIDFGALTADNPDIYAWIYIPDTDIDYPVLRANESDDQYSFAGADGKPDEKGAVYTQIYNNPDFSDFNTVIHGSDACEGAPFKGLHKFEDDVYFNSHREMYIATPATTLTYEVIAAYYDEPSEIIRRYDYSTYKGCNRWINDYLAYKDLSKISVEPQIPLSVDTSFLVTLDCPVNEETGKQFVVIASMLNSGSVELTRFVSDEDDYYEGTDPESIND